MGKPRRHPFSDIRPDHGPGNRPRIGIEGRRVDIAVRTMERLVWFGPFKGVVMIRPGHFYLSVYSLN